MEPTIRPSRILIKSAKNAITKADRTHTEVSLHCLAYNMRRVMSILGIAELVNAMRLMRV